MPLRIDHSGNVKARISYYCGTWTVTFNSFGVVFGIFKTHFGVPVFRIVFDDPLEVVPGQVVVVDQESESVVDIRGV